MWKNDKLTTTKKLEYRITPTNFIGETRRILSSKYRCVAKMISPISPIGYGLLQIIRANDKLVWTYILHHPHDRTSYSIAKPMIMPSITRRKKKTSSPNVARVSNWNVVHQRLQRWKDGLGATLGVERSQTTYQSIRSFYAGSRLTTLAY